MNNSRLTAVIAQGIFLWAVVQDLPGDMVEGSPEQKRWNEWANQYPVYVPLVKREQTELFDRLLLHTMGDN